MVKLMFNSLVLNNNADIEEIKTPMLNLKDGSGMFQSCTSLKKFESDMPALVDGKYMFFGCRNLANFLHIDLRSLKDGECMFAICDQLVIFHVDKMPSLENGNNIFYNTKLDHFDTDMPKLIRGASMFSDCKHLSTFYSKTPALKNGDSMFKRM